MLEEAKQIEQECDWQVDIELTLTSVETVSLRLLDRQTRKELLVVFDRHSLLVGERMIYGPVKVPCKLSGVASVIPRVI